MNICTENKATNNFTSEESKQFSNGPLHDASQELADYAERIITGSEISET